MAELKNVPQGGESNIIEEQNEFAARNAMELHRWQEAATLEIPRERFEWQDYTYWTRAIGAARGGDVEGARAAVQKLTEIDRLRVARQKQAGAAPSGESIDLSEAEAWLAYAQGKADDAVAKLRSAAEREDARDAEPFAMPAREMLGDLLALAPAAFGSTCGVQGRFENVPQPLRCALWRRPHRGFLGGPSHGIGFLRQTDFHLRRRERIVPSCRRPASTWRQTGIEAESC